MSDNYDGPAMAQQILRLRAERDALREEVQKWQKSFGGHLHIKTEDYRKFISERDALRDALESLLVFEPEHCACGERICAEPQEAWQKARAALKARSKA